MTTGTGLMLLGVWIAVAAVWYAPQVHGAVGVSLTLVALGLTVFM